MHETVSIDVETIHETELAVLFSDGDSELWVPKSVIRSDYPEIGEVGEVEIDEWFAQKKMLV